MILFLQKRWKVIAASSPLTICFSALLAVLGFFYLHDFSLYNSPWGYDGPSHLSLVQRYLSEKGLLRHAEFYGGSNPPLYYILGAIIYGIFSGSEKAVQAISLLSVFAILYFLYRLLNLLSKNKILNGALFFNFALLPATLNYAFMLFNYSLGHFFGVLELFILIWMVRTDYQASYWTPIWLGCLFVLGILTSLTNMTLMAGIVIVLLTLARFASWKKGVAVFLFAATVLVLYRPYAMYRVGEFGCIWCTKNRIEVNIPYSEVYPLEFYTTYPTDALTSMDCDKPPVGSLWTRLVNTTFSDYYNYLVGPSLAYDSKLRSGIEKCSNHYITNRKKANLSRLSIYGTPIAVLLCVAFFLTGFSILKNWFRDRKGARIDLILIATAAGFFAQFMSYILQYRDYVNIHGGYLYVGIFALFVRVARRLQNSKWGSFAVLPFLIVYSCLSFYTFYLY